jgi:predicted enzyme related to lactoylglutathione lyase
MMLNAPAGSMKRLLAGPSSLGAPPGFYLIQTGTDEDPGVPGALHCRREVVPGKPMFGFECSLGVDSIDDTIAAIEANGGKIVMPKFHIPTVGTLIFFEDTEGAMQYETAV